MLFLGMARPDGSVIERNQPSPSPETHKRVRICGRWYKSEKRKTRLSSKTVDDNRITHGCVNVSSTFYSKTIKPIFTKAGGVFYVLPDTISVRQAFPAYDAEKQLASIGATAVTSPGR